MTPFVCRAAFERETRHEVGVVGFLVLVFICRVGFILGARVYSRPPVCRLDRLCENMLYCDMQMGWCPRLLLAVVLLDDFFFFFFNENISQSRVLFVEGYDPTPHPPTPFSLSSVF